MTVTRKKKPTSYGQAAQEISTGKIHPNYAAIPGPAPTSPVPTTTSSTGSVAVPSVVRSQAVAKSSLLRSTNAAQALAGVSPLQRVLQQATPKEKKQLTTRLRRASTRTVGNVTGPLTSSQKTFVETLAQKTGLSPRVLAAQTLQEESGAAATSREAEGNHNWLNIGYFDSGPGALTKSGEWSTPKSAAAATARFLKGKEFGASEGIQNILSARGKSDAEQIKTIGNSGWATSDYAAQLANTYGSVGVTKPKPLPKPLVQRANTLLGAKTTNAVLAGKDASTADVASDKPIPKQTVTRYKAIVDEAKKIDSANLPYVWGGGHVAGKVPGPRKISGYDCSGVTSRILQSAGVKLPGGVTSGELATTPLLKPGPGAVTVYANAEHVFMKIGNHYYGTSSAGNTGGGGFFSKAIGDSEVAAGNGAGAFTVRHVPGLGDDVAKRMGVRLDKAGISDAPGMTYGNGGTTATINPGAGVVQSAPGASSKPILSDRFAKLQALRGKSSAGGIAPTANAPFSARAVTPQDVAEQNKATADELRARFAPKRKRS